MSEPAPGVPVVARGLVLVGWVGLWLIWRGVMSGLSSASGRTCGLPGVLWTGVKAWFQAACLVRRCSSSTSLGMRYPKDEWSRL